MLGPWGKTKAFIISFRFPNFLVIDNLYFEKFHIVNDAGHCENGIYALKANYGFADLTLESLKGPTERAAREIKSLAEESAEIHRSLRAASRRTAPQNKA